MSSLAEEIARALGNGNEVKNRDGWLTCCPVHGDKNPSMSIKDNDEGSVDVFCHTNNCDFREIKDAIRAMGLLPEWKPDPEKRKSAAPSKKEGSSPKSKKKEEESFIWKMAGKDGLHHAKEYLEGRAITMDLPVCIRWNSYKHKESGEMVNMIVAAASKPSDKKVYAIQRLFIDTDTHKKTGAKMHGPCEGRGIWFNRKGDMTEILSGEGIETTLSAMQATGQNGVASLSASGTKNLIIPDETETLYLLVDSDPVREKQAASMPGQKAAYSLAERFVKSRDGRKAYFVSPDDTCFSDNPSKIDFNDLLKEFPDGSLIRKRFDCAVAFEDLAWSPPDDSDHQDSTNFSGYPDATIEALQEMNKKYAAVLLGGDFRIAKEGFDKVAKKHTLSFLKMTALYSFYANSRVGVPVGANRDIEYKELAKVWMSWEDRRTYDDVTFDPSEKSPPSTYNLFRGFPLKPKKGDWSKMRNHIFQVICDGNEEHFNYVLGWMARAVQDPGGDKPGVALVLKGGKGIGKGVFANYFGAIFGEAFLPIADSDSFTGRFNMHLSKSLVVFLDEAVWGGDKKAEGKLKQLITEPTILFEPKGIDSLTMGNFINVIIASNEDWVVPATGDERRYCVLEPSAEFQQDTKYFAAIIHERNNGGIEAMMYDLLQHDFSDVDLRSAPMTSGLADQVRASLPSTLEFWFDVIDREYILSDKETGRPTKTRLQPESYVEINELWPGTVFKYELYTEYLNWCHLNREMYPRNQTHFWRETFLFWPGGKPSSRLQRTGPDGKYVDAIRMPVVQEARLAFSDMTNIQFDDEEEIDMDEKNDIPFENQF